MPLSKPVRATVEAERRPGLLCDRDGTLIEHRVNYILEPSHIHLLPGVAAALCNAQRHGFVVVVLSNQSPVGRGLLSVTDALRLHRQVLGDLKRGRITVAGSYLCPHAPAHDCTCRKPKPGMVQRSDRKSVV